MYRKTRNTYEQVCRVCTYCREYYDCIEANKTFKKENLPGEFIRLGTDDVRDTNARGLFIPIFYSLLFYALEIENYLCMYYLLLSMRERKRYT